MASKVNDLKVCVAFHVPTEESTERADLRIVEIVERFFDKDAFKREAKSAEVTGGEIVYSFEIPLMVHGTVLNNFFESLLAVFNHCSDYLPHFTQMKEKEAITIGKKQNSF